MIHPAEAVTGFCWSENRAPISHFCSTTYYHRYTMVLPNFQTDHWDHISQHSSIVAGFRWNPETSRGPRPPTAGLTWPIISRAQLAATETKAKDRKRAIASSTSHIRPTAVAVKASTNMQHTRHTIDQKWASAFQLDFWIFASRHSKPCLMSGNLGPYGAPCTESKAVVHDFGVVQGPKNCKAHYCLWVVIWCHLPSKNKVTRNNDDPRESVGDKWGQWVSWWVTNGDDTIRSTPRASNGQNQQWEKPSIGRLAAFWTLSIITCASCASVTTECTECTLTWAKLIKYT